MPDRLLAILAWLKPPELHENGQEDASLIAKLHSVRQSRWQWRMFWAVSILLLVAVTDQWVQWGAGPRLIGFGFTGYAWASDVDRKIMAATTPIQEEVAAQSKSIEQLSRLVNEQLASSLAKDIRLLTTKRCLEKDAAERERLFGEIEKLQRQHREFAKERYDAPECGDLIR